MPLSRCCVSIVSSSSRATDVVDDKSSHITRTIISIGDSPLDDSLLSADSDLCSCASVRSYSWANVESCDCWWRPKVQIKEGTDVMFAVKSPIIRLNVEYLPSAGSDASCSMKTWSSDSAGKTIVRFLKVDEGGGKQIDKVGKYVRCAANRLIIE